MVPAIIGAPHAALGVGVNGGVDTRPLGSMCDGDPDPSERPLWPAVAGKAGPGGPAVGGAIDAAARAGVRLEVIEPGIIPRLPRGRVKQVRVGRVGGKVDDPGL